MHRIDAKVPVEESLGALKKMEEAEKIRHVGLSEVTPKEIEQKHAKVLPIVSVQNQPNVLPTGDRKGTLAYCEKENLGFIPVGSHRRRQEFVEEAGQSAGRRSETSRR